MRQGALTDMPFMKSSSMLLASFTICTRKCADTSSSSKISPECQVLHFYTFDHIVEALKTAFPKNTSELEAVSKNGDLLLGSEFI